MMNASLLASFRQRQILPGFFLTAGITLFWLGLIVLLPLTALLFRPWQDGAAAMIHALHDRRMYAALRVSFGYAFLAVLMDLLLGLLLAWTLVRLKPPGTRLINALIDLPFAMPTAVTGITLATLYGPNGWLGKPLLHLGFPVAFTPAGIVVALMFVGLPFIVRTVEPVLRATPHDVEEAAFLLGATPWQRFFRVVLPSLLPALISGFGLAFSRCVGEYGSVIFIAGNQPFHSEVASLLIVMRLQEFNYAGATSIAAILLILSLLCLALVGQVRRIASRGLVREDGR
ncbi:sulfate ABC transporter permease subunit CysT [Gluconobacter morbifer]|uniref:Sulfate transport system permease protein CysT n=1 Tax=Gluconobacter morbifer G707 TaxID=1088869 RepID=G6XHG7_9PROT|nr:sulfate ABC transporter permease subunit CysT [Gluconobacter morbifer]EHH69625.1 sulfate transporter permease CysT [Gluconobacter morbifer G707]